MPSVPRLAIRLPLHVVLASPLRVPNDVPCTIDRREPGGGRGLGALVRVMFQCEGTVCALDVGGLSIGKC